jgi:hypothetical protein
MKHDANAIIQKEGAAGLRGAFDAAVTLQPRAELLVAEWLKRQLPPRDYLLGNVLCTTSRWEIYGDTGIGKTLFALEMAGAIASGNNFLGWEARRRARVMYLDGELPAETFKERIQLVADQYGSDIALFGYNRDVLGPSDMPPLNTPEGETWLLREIEAVKPDVIFFDSIMCLLAGVMSEEESWAPVKLLMRKISGQRIAQIWLHHTGHDASKGFGTKTREWELDTVIALSTVENAEGVFLDFRKARLRTPQTIEDFKSRMILRDESGWSVTGGDVAKVKTAAGSEIGKLKIAILSAYDRLADGLPTSSGFNGAPVRKLKVDALREELKFRGFLEAKETGGLTATARSSFHRAKTDLLTETRLYEGDGLIWKSIA